MKDVCVAFKVHQGWLNAVAVLCSGDEPVPVHAGRVNLADPGDREVLEPYHVAGGWSGLERVPRPPDPAAVIRRGRRKQSVATRRRLRSLRDVLQDQGLTWRRAAVLTGRGRFIDLQQIPTAHSLVHVAEGEAMRAAARAALRSLAIETTDQDERLIALEAGRQLGSDDPDGFMKGRRPDDARRWTKEERTIGLAAWLNRWG